MGITTAINYKDFKNLTKLNSFFIKKSKKDQFEVEMKTD